RMRATVPAILGSVRAWVQRINVDNLRLVELPEIKLSKGQTWPMVLDRLQNQIEKLQSERTRILALPVKSATVRERVMGCVAAMAEAGNPEGAVYRVGHNQPFAFPQQTIS